MKVPGGLGKLIFSEMVVRAVYPPEKAHSFFF